MRYVLFLICMLIVCLIPPPVSSAPAVSLLGSDEALIRENIMMEKETLSRVENGFFLGIHKILGLLVPIPEGIPIDERVPEEFRYVRPWVASFLEKLEKAYFKKFKRYFPINSAVRTTSYQKDLRQANNGNAAEIDGAKSSSHISGATIDIGKLKMKEVEKNWLRKCLLKLKAQGLVEATEETYQAVFHVMVSRKTEGKELCTA